MERIDDLALLTALATGDVDVYLRYSAGPGTDGGSSLDSMIRTQAPRTLTSLG
ncbi:hypothetical protein KCMC57_up53300 [Kitasatospora sp. CMC57]|uniref:Uncharacterized protein n=1 Tax=Kitasatospora sp. CMC57 TaxID=3231513 RepID=A0AB33K094_9ACTN